jgi:primosomal protein N''
VKGGAGALTSKCICADDMLQEDASYFQTEKHTPAEWETRFDHAKFAKYGNGPSVTKSAQEMDDEDCTVVDYMPTPKKPRTQEQLDGGTASLALSWVELPSLEDMVRLKSVQTAASDTPNRKSENAQAIGENFEVLKQALPKMVERSAVSLDELREHYGRLAKALGKFDRRVGHSDGFGVMASVTSTFDGLRYLHEIGEERNKKFINYPYERLVAELTALDKSITSLQTIDRWADEATELRQLNANVVRSVDSLKTKTVSHLVNFYQKIHIARERHSWRYSIERYCETSVFRLQSGIGRPESSAYSSWLRLLRKPTGIFGSAGQYSVSSRENRSR